MSSITDIFLITQTSSEQIILSIQAAPAYTEQKNQLIQKNAFC